jgi:CheY-like chemotaxis protein
MEQPLIAIVDDDESLRDATECFMRSAGFSAGTFSCGADFLSSPDLSRTACLVTDLNMPRMLQQTTAHLVGDGKQLRGTVSPSIGQRAPYSRDASGARRSTCSSRPISRTPVVHPIQRSDYARSLVRQFALLASDADDCRSKVFAVTA